MIICDKEEILPKHLRFLDLPIESEDINNFYIDEIFNMEEVEAITIKRALSQANSNRSEAARLLGITRATLLRKIRRYGIDEVVSSPR